MKMREGRRRRQRRRRRLRSLVGVSLIDYHVERESIKTSSMEHWSSHDDVGQFDVDFLRQVESQRSIVFTMYSGSELPRIQM